MKKMKKFLAMFLAMAMVLGMSITSFAAISGASLTVKGLSTEDGAKATVKLYLLYELDENDNLWKRADWATMLPDGKDIVDKEELSELKNATILEAVKTASANQKPDKVQEDIISGSYKFDGLQAGAYFVTVTDSTGHVEYGPMVGVTYKYDSTSGLMVASTDAEIVAKPSKITTQKEQQGSAENAPTTGDIVAEYGDLITYTIKETVPPVGSTFVIYDTLTNGSYKFSGNAVKGVTPKFEVKVNGADPTPAVAEPVPTIDGATQTFSLDLAALVATGNYVGQQVTVTYTVEVTSVNEITNTARTDHGNGVESTPGTTDAWTGSIDITKTEEATTNKLNGAKFVVYRINSDNAKEYATIADGHVTGTWTVYTDEEFKALTSYDGMTIETAGTGADNKPLGIATVAGLKEGTYYFKEVVAPDGFSINTTDVAATLTATKDNAGKITAVTGNTGMTDTRLGQLPSTGGIGTTIFTIGGCAIMIIAAGLYFSLRRRTAK